jgi:PAS domain S-box-containing protein
MHQLNNIPPHFGSEPFFAISYEGRVTGCNEAAEQITGFTSSALQGKNFADLFAQPGKVAEILKEMDKTGMVNNFPLSLNCNEEQLTVFLNGFCERSPGQQVNRIFMTVNVAGVNKNQSANDHQKILKEVSDYKFALEESAIVAITDQKGIIRHVNDNFCRISKYSREELLGQDHRIINSGFHSKDFIRELWVTIANGKIWKGELKNRAKDGTHYWVDTTIVPFLNHDGKPYQYLAIRSDITSRKEAEENLEKTLKEISDYKYALDESSIVAITDQKGIIKYANHNFCKISKFSYEELLGQDHRIINSGYHPKEFIRKLWSTIANGKIWRGELKNRAKDGSTYWVDTTIVPFLDGSGKPYQYVAIRADITQRKQGEEEIKVLNEELEKRVKERTEEIESFSYSVSHDLRAPLRAVNGYARILEEDYRDMLDEEGKRLLGEVQQNAKKMGVLIDDLLDFSRLGRKEIDRSVIDMNKLAALALREINQSVSHHATIECTDLHPVRADFSLLQHVMINLVSNAIKYSSKRDSPLIQIRSECKGEEVIFSIKDNGVGFDMEYVNKLFGVFQRLHSNEEFPGTGVGLAIVQRIIHKHNGRVWAEGKTGEGATFYFTLPHTD